MLCEHETSQKHTKAQHFIPYVHAFWEINN